MVTIRKGYPKKHAVSDRLAEFFNQNDDFEGILYIGYPILFSGAESYTLDALWISKTYGVIAFDLISGTEISTKTSENQDNIFSLIEIELKRNTRLRRGRLLDIPIEVISFAPAVVLDAKVERIVSDEATLLTIIGECTKWEDSSKYDDLVATLQSVISLKSRPKRDNIKKPDSKGSKIKAIEDEIATLDVDQEEAIITYYDGIQRIRGLAGSGKTIVLALKAAYLHAQNQDWSIAVTFNTRSLKQQFKDLIDRFFREKKHDYPDWNKIQVINAWGSPTDEQNEKGVYCTACIENGVEYLDFRAAKHKASLIGRDNNYAFELACQTFLEETKEKPIIEKYDAIFVDEAQDLSEKFLSLCYKLLKPPKRLIFAYDELQRLNEGTPLGNPKRFIDESINFDDKILKRCYRNSRPLLVTAHSLGFGIYREGGMAQFFDDPKLWFDVGYSLKEGRLEPNQNVVLERTPLTSPLYLEKHSEIDDLIKFHIVKNKAEQAREIAAAIHRNVTEDELDYQDIVVINPIALVTRDETATVRAELKDKYNIDSHIAGDANANIFFREKSIAFSGINRAKGNEVPMVYIMNTHDCYAGSYGSRDLMKRRNILFTAITRSKAWVRLVGIGSAMIALKAEYEMVKSKNFELQFKYPTVEEIDLMNKIYRDISETEKDRINKEQGILSEIAQIIQKIKENRAYVEDYPPEYQDLLRKMLEK